MPGATVMRQEPFLLQRVSRLVHLPRRDEEPGEVGDVGGVLGQVPEDGVDHHPGILDCDRGRMGMPPPVGDRLSGDLDQSFVEAWHVSCRRP